MAQADGKQIETEIHLNIEDPQKIKSSEVDRIIDTEDGPIGLKFARKEQPGPERQAWGGEIEFILTCVGYAVGLGNVWRFPYLCYSNGGGAFLIPYVIMIILIGLPLFFLEFAFGQFASLGPISIWNMAPLFKGIGYSMVFLSWILGIYYIIIVSHCLFFLGSSFTNHLPWSDCENFWNTKNCIPSNFTGNTIGMLTPAQEFYQNYVLEKSASIDEFGAPSWKLTLCLLACWIIVCFALIRGVASLGKVAYFTAIFPYVVLTTLLIKSLLSEGSGSGILFYITPVWSKIANVKVWIQAATQIFFSLSVGNGGLIAMSSFNTFKHNCYRDAFLIVIINCGTSVFAGFVIFANLGIMAHEKNVSIEAVATQGPGLVFEVYPEALAKFPVAPMWAVIFFMMMFTLGMGSELSTVESVLSAIIDELSRKKLLKTKVQVMLFRIVACSLGFILGLPFVSRGGPYLIDLVDTTLSGYPLLIIAFLETVVISYVYGVKQFKRDVALMIGKTPNIYWIGSWAVVAPLVTLGLIISSFFENPFENSGFSSAWIIFSHALSIAIVIIIPIFFLYKYCREGGLILLKEFLKPTREWGPAEQAHREEFIQELTRKRKAKNQEVDGRSEPNIPNILQGEEYDSTNSFFQSKYSIVDKFTNAHTKEVLKRTGADLNSPEAIAFLSASQSAMATQSNAIISQMMSQAMAGAAAAGKELEKETNIDSKQNQNTETNEQRL